MNTSDSVLAIDLGSTWCKAAYVDRHGQVLAEGRGYSRGGPAFGHAAADLQDAWDVLVRAVHDASSNLGNRQPAPAAIAISCRKAPGIWLDSGDNPVELPRDALEQAGRRDIEACYAADVWGDSGPFAYGYGVDLIGNTRWLRRAYPDLWSKVERAGTLHNWLVYRLTGRWVASPAAGPVRFAWPEAAVTLSGLDLDAFPTVVESYRQVAGLNGQSAQDLGLPPDTPVVTGTHDGAAANLGAGAMHVGDTCLTLGTNGVIRVVTGAPLERQFGYPIVEGRWAMVRDIVGIAHHLDHVVAAIDGQGTPVSAERHASLTEDAADVPVGAGGVHFPVPEDDVLSEEREAERSRVAAEHPAGVVYRAALEGIVLAFRGVVQVVRQAGAEPQHYVVTGGATANKLLLRMMSGVLGAPVHTTPDEAGVRGAAILAAVGVGWYPTLDGAVEAMVPEGVEVCATADEMHAYAHIVKSVDLPLGVAPGDAVRG
jgi:sugar (pentulose or hexulose) kinase